MGVAVLHGVFQMGTGHIPESTTSEARIGVIMWLLLMGLLLPPIGVTLVGNELGTIPNQSTWIVVLFVPFFLILLTMPRHYRLVGDVLVITGLVYRKRVRRDQVREIRTISPVHALTLLGSVFCSNPSKALIVERTDGFRLVISPSNPTPFLAWGARRNEP